MYLKPSGKPLVPVMDNHTLPVGQSGGESGGQDWEEGLQEGPELLHCYFLLGCIGSRVLTAGPSGKSQK